MYIKCWGSRGSIPVSGKEYLKYGGDTTCLEIRTKSNKCWGSRGSIPVSGKEYLKYGGDTTCLEIRTKSNDIIIIDAGTGIRRLGNLLIKENQNKYHFIFTHTHWDHVMGFPYFKPLYSNHTEFRMHRCPFHSQLVKDIISNIMAPPHFPVKYSDIKAELFYEEACPMEFEIGSVKVVPIAISHPNGGSGYKFIEDGKSFVFLTDNELGFIHPGGLAYKDYVKFSLGADLLIHDAVLSMMRNTHRKNIRRLLIGGIPYILMSSILPLKPELKK
jgi:phosphoribosyl 1,2-cyclic phosphodiesterase